MNFEVFLRRKYETKTMKQDGKKGKEVTEIKKNLQVLFSIY